MHSSCLASVTHFYAYGSRVAGRIGSLFASIVKGHAILDECLSVVLLMDMWGSCGFSGHCPLISWQLGLNPSVESLSQSVSLLSA